jgi:hypothetical protein
VIMNLSTTKIPQRGIHPSVAWHFFWKRAKGLAYSSIIKKEFKSSTSQDKLGKQKNSLSRHYWTQIFGPRQAPKGRLSPNLVTTIVGNVATLRNILALCSLQTSHETSKLRETRDFLVRRWNIWSSSTTPSPYGSSFFLKGLKQWERVPLWFIKI